MTAVFPLFSSLFVFERRFWMQPLQVYETAFLLFWEGSLTGSDLSVVT